MRKRLVIPLALAAFATLLSVCFERFDHTATAQTRRQRSTARPAGPTIDYSRFSHATKKHQEACITCHKVPTKNWREARGFPDVADFPDHDACVSCHRQQFFKGARPIICGDCHTTVSPRNEARFHFRNPAAPHQFTIEFPHDKHQDVIASLLRSPESGEAISFLKVSFLSEQSAPKRTTYNNCEICHQTSSKDPGSPPGGWHDAEKPLASAFKSLPDSHAYCFSCHWRGQKPTNTQCDGCHKLANPYKVADWPEQRISIKFDHNKGGDKGDHLRECTTCHLNITKPPHLKRTKIDVPILACQQCHSQERGSAPSTAPDCTRLSGAHAIGDELQCLKADKQYTCHYCHLSNVGQGEPPVSHFTVANEARFRRKDLK